MWIHKQGNTTKYLKDLAKQDRLAKADPEFIKLKRQDLKDQLKALDELEKVSKEDTEEVKKILEMAQTTYQQYATEGLPPSEFNKYLRASILPKLKKAHCDRFEVEDIVEMCAKGVINV